MAIQLKIQIQGIKNPPVWRKLLIPDTFNFRQLHYAIQLAFGWGCCHLYQFEKQAYSHDWIIREPQEEDDFWSSEPFLAAKTKVYTFVMYNGVKSFVYVYDFGDSWVHKITIETVTKDKITTPFCLAGKGDTPPEDCGGVYGYEELKELFTKDPKDLTEEEQERIDWAMDIKEEMRFNEFDILQVNEDLSTFKTFEKEMNRLWGYKK